MEQSCHHPDQPTIDWDQYTEALFTTLFAAGDSETKLPEDQQREAERLLAAAQQTDKTGPILDLFSFLLNQARDKRCSPLAFAIDRSTLETLARKHQQIDEHLVSIGGRLTQARPIAAEANERVDAYLAEKDIVAPSGIELWDTMLENQQRIKKALSMTLGATMSFSARYASTRSLASAAMGRA